MLKTALAKLLTLKVGAAALAVTASGGVALAAANGALPNPMAAPSAKPSAHATGKPADAGEKAKVAPSAGKGSPSPSLVGLCRAYRAGAGDNPGKALENPAFTVLIDTAGGKDNVAAYCDTLLATAKGKPSDAPSARPTSHPSGKPADRPTAPEAKPTRVGKPAVSPAN